MRSRYTHGSVCARMGCLDGRVPEFMCVFGRLLVNTRVGRTEEGRKLGREGRKGVCVSARARARACTPTCFYARRTEGPSGGREAAESSGAEKSGGKGIEGGIDRGGAQGQD